ncbi:MAG: carbohydrate kinase family protein [bacterium]|nr:carbohydrate kinase family protein [bacterium]MDA1024384.1 carbohydrate kinase family protein [bacterium]
MYDIVTIGSAVRDVFLISHTAKSLETKDDHNRSVKCIELGDKIEADEIHFSTGGGATNAAVTFARFGFHTSAIAKVGNDDSGNAVIQDLRTAGVNTTHMAVNRGSMTGYSTLFTVKSGERTVIVHRGVSTDLTKRDVNSRKIKAKWVYLTSLGGNMKLIEEIISNALKNGSNIAFNPGSLELESGMRIFSRIIPHLAVINMNREEAADLTKQDDVKNMLKTLQLGSAIAIITDGSKGSYAYDGKEAVFVRARPEIKGISRTGAGDAFGSGTVGALMKGYTLKDALKVGTLNAESVIQEHGAKNGILKRLPNKRRLSIFTAREIRL